jgi:rhamnosyl/mannosyltransferase
MFPWRLRTAAKNADIIHHHLPNPLSTLSQLTAGSMDATVVATYHSDIVRQSTALMMYQPLLKRFLNSVDRILVTSDPLLNHSSILQPYQEKCDVVPLSVNLNAVDKEDPTPLDVEIASPVILFVGRLNYYKGVEYLVEAMEQTEATLLIVGDGRRRSKLERQARKCSVDDRIKFLGYIPDKQLASAYQTADLFVLPSVESSEAFGIVQLEAMARGVPVINTSLPTGVPWVSLDGKTGRTVQPRDSKALAEAISELLADNSRRRQYSKQARKRVEKLFTKEKMLNNVERSYEKALDS